MTSQYQPLHPPTRYEIAAWIITGAVLLLLLPLHLLGALLAGLLLTLAAGASCASHKSAR